MNIFNHSFDNVAIAINCNSDVNPIDQIIKLHEGKIALYKRMPKEKDKMMVRLEKLIKEK